MCRKPLSIAVLQLMCTWSFLVLGTGPLRAGESAADLVTFRGRVLDRQGQAVAGAKVMLYQMDVGMDRYSYSGAVLHSERIGEQVTGADGAYAFTASRFSVDEGEVFFIEGEGLILAQKEGFALGWTVLKESQSGQRDIVLDEPQELRGLVVDEGGSPVGDAEVSIGLAVLEPRIEFGAMMRGGAVPQLLVAARQSLTVRTDNQGRFVFANLPANTSFGFLIHKPGRARTWSESRFAPGQSDIKLILPPEARIEGEVVENVTGKPMGGVRVNVRPVWPQYPFLDEPVTSKPDGTFSVGGLATYTYIVQLEPQGKETADWMARPVQVTLEAGETARDIRLALTAGCWVEVVVKKETGKPAAERGVAIFDAEGGDPWRGKTDAGGMVRARLLPGTYQVGRIYVSEYEYADPQEPFTIAEGETKRFERTLGGMPAVSGVVYDDAGVPLEGVTLQIIPGDHEETSSDVQGRFKAIWDPRKWPPADYLVARHAARNLAAAEPAGREETSSRMDVRLRPGVALAGQVTDLHGKALAGADIQVVLYSDSWSQIVMASRGVKTDAQGRYEVETLPAKQRYRIKASADNYGQVGTVIDATETAGNRVQVSTLALPVANLSVSGVVVDAAGQPVSGASIYSYPDEWIGQPSRHTRSDAAGKFVLEHLCAGEIYVSVHTQPRPLAGELLTEGGARDVRIVLTERGSRETPFVPRTPAFLLGKPLPELKSAGVELPADANDRMLLVCLWDLNRRPERDCLAWLTSWAASSGGKRVTVVAVQAGKVEPRVLSQWMERTKSPFPVGCLTGDIEKARLAWGAVSLPHLILTDKKHIVVAEGFSVSELHTKIQAAAGQGSR
jgi:hypothetical protein